MTLIGFIATIVSRLSGIWDFTIKPETRVSAGFRILAFFEITLIIATWPLWWGHSEFPQVPLLPVFTSDLWLSKGLTALLLLSACLIAVSRWPEFRRNAAMRSATMGGFIAGLALVVLNQHRLQAWHWLFLLNMGWMLMIPCRDLLTLMRHTICTIYVCSALSRFSSSPQSGVTAAIVYKSLAMVGITGLTADSLLTNVLCHALTIGELLVGLLLLKRKTRLAGCIGAMLLHFSLLIVLGPLGLNHHAGVLLWNVCFLCFVPALFWGRDLSTAVSGDNRPGVTRAAITVAWLFPLSGLVGLADNWPTWQVYSARPENWILFIHDEDRGRVPHSLAEMIGVPIPLSEWCPVKLDRWSLDDTGSPSYPQARFQLATTAWILAQIPDDVRFQIEVSEPRTPFWWERRQRLITTRDELQREHRRFMLNSRAVQ